MKEDLVIFLNDSPYGDYKKGETGVLKGFVNGGDGTPCAVVRKSNDTYRLAPLTSIVYLELDQNTLE